MSVYLLKQFSLLLYPLTWVLFLLIMAMVFLFFRRMFLAGQSLALGFIILWIAAMPVTGQWLMLKLESQYPAKLAMGYGSADAIVLLGGGVKGANEPLRPLPDVNDAGDRIWFAAQLYRYQKAPIIIASGGALGWTGAQQTEANAMRMILQDFGVPAERVIEENKSLNTQENARYTQEILAQTNAKRIFLVTSAAHMPRAYRVFRAELPDMIIIPTATDHRVSGIGNGLIDWIPQASGLEMTNQAWHEWVGSFVYELKAML
jgi:uncharacterized SAM-binding protein YcdF (DUF218 family)